MDGSSRHAVRMPFSSASSAASTVSPGTAREAAARLRMTRAASTPMRSSSGPRICVGPSRTLTRVSPRTSRATRTDSSQYTVSNQPSPTGGRGTARSFQRASQEPNLKLTRRSDSSSQAAVLPTRRCPSENSTRFSRRPASRLRSWKTPVQGRPRRPLSMRKSTSFSLVQRSFQRPLRSGRPLWLGSASTAASMSERSAPRSMHSRRRATASLRTATSSVVEDIANGAIDRARRI
mmetsp:Transcript_26777/g.89661  ORF Transcript_26777/g.89661 Transcript_26777/m.89661 type:complete len:235 (-) Transcript_26777:106-810(-)